MDFATSYHYYNSKKPCPWQYHEVGFAERIHKVNILSKLSIHSTNSEFRTLVSGVVFEKLYT